MSEITVRPWVLPRRLGRARCWMSEERTTFDDAVKRSEHEGGTPLHAWFEHIPVLVSTLRTATRTKRTTEADWLETLNMVLALPGLDVNAIDHNGRTALYLAVDLALRGRTLTFLHGAVERLLAAGADVWYESEKRTNVVALMVRDEHRLLRDCPEHAELLQTVARAGDCDMAQIPAPRMRRTIACEPMDVPFAIGHTFACDRESVRFRRFKDVVMEARAAGRNDNLLGLWFTAMPDPIVDIHAGGSEGGDTQDVLRDILALRSTNVNHRGDQGHTALHLVHTIDGVHYNDPGALRWDVTNRLLRAGADPLIRDDEGKTPLDLCIEVRGDDPFEGVQVLLEAFTARARREQKAELHRIADQASQGMAPAAPRTTRARKRL